MKIYLSPANHYKPYATGETEREQMEKLAVLLKAELEKYAKVEVVIAQIHASTQQYDGRPEEACRQQANLYVALHTNASGASPVGGRATGACGFYHPSSRASKQIAESVVRELNAICPIKSNRAAQPAIYPWTPTYNNFGELREPMRLNIVPVLIEHEFHDNADGAEWIVNHLPQIAQADARGIAKALNLRKVQHKKSALENLKDAIDLLNEVLSEIRQ